MPKGNVGVEKVSMYDERNHERDYYEYIAM